MARSAPHAEATVHVAAPHPSDTANPEPGGALDVAALFRQHARMVARIGFRILGRTQDVEDLVQDVFLDAIRDQSRIRNAAAIQGWLAVCTIRRARRRLRTRKLRRALGLDQVVDYTEVVDRSASPAQGALLSRLYEALDALPVEQRLAWTLRHVEGEDLESVARLCDCSLATVKRRIAEANRRIQCRV